MLGDTAGGGRLLVGGPLWLSFSLIMFEVLSWFF